MVTRNNNLGAGTPAAEVKVFVISDNLPYQTPLSKCSSRTQIIHLRVSNPEANSSLVKVMDAKSVNSSDVATTVKLAIFGLKRGVIIKPKSKIICH